LTIAGGWRRHTAFGLCHRIPHGGLLFIDLRDHYGLTQCVVDRFLQP
jgi:aspartyl-tRNA synthetase